MDQSTHDIRRANWLSIINQCQERPADITAKQWLADNGIKEKAYYYWLRKFRKEACSQIQLPVAAQTTDVSFAEITMPAEVNHSQTDTVPIATGFPTAVIKHNGLILELSNDISEDLLSRLLLEVIHA